MNNLLKSKFILGFMVMMAMFVGYFSFSSIADASYSHTINLSFGSTGAQVVSLQKILNVTPTSGYFGNITRRAVMDFQQSRGIPANGVVDSMTGSAISNTYNNPFSDGCYSNVGYSTTTGKPCNITVSSFPDGCTSTTGYSVTTGVRCNIDTSSLYPGCTSNNGFSALV
jgi:peptidoglycan hydrolase-like protein with peptidoglycan-binding domain